MFLKRAVMENGIPFRMTLPKTPYVSDRGYRAMMEIGESAEKNGISDFLIFLMKKLLKTIVLF